MENVDVIETDNVMTQEKLDNPVTIGTSIVVNVIGIEKEEITVEIAEIEIVDQ